MKKLLKQVTLTTATRLKDRSVKMSFVTDLEQSSPEFIEIDEALNSKGILYFKSDSDLTQEEIDSIDNTDIEFEGKTKSQRLKNVLYVLSKQEDADPKEFYAQKMEEIIEHLKRKLD